MRIVIFSGFNQRAIIAFLRTLEKNQLEYSIIALSSNDPILTTSYKNKVDCIRNCISLDFIDIKNCIDIIKQKTNAEKYIIAPSTEALNRFLLKHRAEFEEMGCIIPLVEKELYEQISDKESFGYLCIQNGINIPEEVTFSKDNIPFVIKPKKYETDGEIFSPILVTDDNIFKSINYNSSISYCQEFLDGKSYYLLYYFAKNGDIVKLAQENFLQQADGKSIIAAKNVDYEMFPETEKFERLFTKLKYQGLVMVEVRIRENRLYMIEANPRFWGPSQLFVDCGRNLFEYFLQDWGFDVNIEDNIRNVKYYWTGGLSENTKEFESIKEEQDEYIKSDIYNRRDTLNIYKEELAKKLIEKYNDISKHSQYQIPAQNLSKFLPAGKLIVKSRAEKERFDYIQEKISLEGKKILDIGANTGYFSFEAVNSGAKHVTCYEGNPSHADFINCGINLLNLQDKMIIKNEYYDFNQTEQYDICFLLNVLHHIGDDYGKNTLSIEKAKECIIEQLNKMAYISKELVFQLGFNWKGNIEKCLFENGLKQEMIDYIKCGTKDCWDIKFIGIASSLKDVVKYENLNDKNIERQDKLGEFLNRPVFIMESKRYY